MPAKTTRKYINLSVDELTIGNGEFTLPTVDGLVGQIIVTDGAGNLTWQSPGGTGTVTSITAGTGLNGGTITTSGTIDLANTAVTPGSYTSADITVDAQGRITAASNGSSGSGTVTSITAGVGLNGGTITTTGTIDLSNTTVVAGSYNLANITVDAQGRITSASSGSAGSITIGDPILSGTANRVLYEDASNQLAESGDLVFNGTSLGVGVTSSSTWRLSVEADGGLLGIQNTVTTDASVTESRNMNLSNSLITGGDITGSEGLEGVKMQSQWLSGGVISGANKNVSSFHSDMEMRAATTADEFVSFKSDMLVNDISAIVTNYYGLKIQTPTVTTGSITNRYGVYVEDTLSLNYFAGCLGIATTPSGTACLDLAAATSSKSQINLVSSGGVDVFAPNSGDLWWNGTNLYFNDGSINVDLLDEITVSDTSTIDLTKTGSNITADVVLSSLTEDYLSITGSPSNGSLNDILSSDGAGGFSWQTIFDFSPALTGTISTGIIDGGVMSINTSGANNTLDISAGNGVIVDSFTDPNNPIITEVSWSSFTNITPSFIASAVGTYILIQPNGTLLELPVTSPPTAIQKRDNIFLGFVGHADNLNVINVFNFPMPKAAPANQVEELADAIGPFNISGNNIILPGPGLTLDKGAGTSYFYGGNFQVNSKIPSTVTASSLTGPTLIYAKQDLVYGPNNPSGGANTDVDPTQYDNAGTLTLISPTNQFTGHRIYLDPINNLIVFQYGQNLYSTIADAEAAISTETYVVPDVLNDVTYLLGVLIVEAGATDLSVTADAKFISQSKFAGGGGGGGGGGGTVTLQDAYDNSATPEILTDVSRGALTLRRGSAADSDAMYEVQNGAGSVTFSLNGNGTVTAGAWQGSVVDEVYGGTGKASYIVGNILYADTTSSLDTINIGSAGTFLRSNATTPEWSTTSFPNAATTGDLIVASSANNYDNLTAVAQGSVLLSRGIGVQPSYGLVIDGSTIDFTVGATLTAEVALDSLTEDYLSGLGTGTAGQVLVSDGATGFSWTSSGTSVNPPDVSSYSASTVNLTNTANTYDYYVGIDSSSNTVTVNLPAASGGAVIYNIKDIGCASATNRIRIVVNGVDTIVTTTTGNSDYTIETNGAAIKLVSDGTSTWWLQ